MNLLLIISALGCAPTVLRLHQNYVTIQPLDRKGSEHMEIIGPLQLRVMHHIWEHGGCTVHDVHSSLNAEPEAPKLAYTTILTVMRNLARRNILQQKPAGRSHMFSPEISEADYKEALLKQIGEDFFSGDHARMIDILSKAKEAKIP